MAVRKTSKFVCHRYYNKLVVLGMNLVGTQWLEWRRGEERKTGEGRQGSIY